MTKREYNRIKKLIITNQENKSLLADFHERVIEYVISVDPFMEHYKLTDIGYGVKTIVAYMQNDTTSMGAFKLINETEFLNFLKAVKKCQNVKNETKNGWLKKLY